MAGIYIHVPFCRKKCHYCDFYKITRTGLINEYTEAVKKELEKRKDYTLGEGIESIYFGGGTPSLLSPQQTGSIINAISGLHKIAPQCEITLEANPDDINQEYISGLKDHTLINRISLGIQSFFDEDLVFLNRRHNARTAFRSMELCTGAGYSNLSADLIYAIPGLTAERWKDNIQYAVSSGAVHISAYHLSIEPGTAMHRMVTEGRVRPADEETGREQYEILCNLMNREGYVHYEISNFCRDGYYAVHNTNYWRKKIYLGLGPSAHSFNLQTRQWNHTGVKKYIRDANEGLPASGTEKTDGTRSYNEYIMLALRTIWGVDTKNIETNYGLDYLKAFESVAAGFLESGQLRATEGRYVLTEDAWFVSDGIIREFMIF